MFPFKGGISEKMPFSTNVKKFGHLRLKVNFFPFMKIKQNLFTVKVLLSANV